MAPSCCPKMGEAAGQSRAEFKHCLLTLRSHQAVAFRRCHQSQQCKCTKSSPPAGKESVPQYINSKTEWKTASVSELKLLLPSSRARPLLWALMSFCCCWAAVTQSNGTASPALCQLCCPGAGSSRRGWIPWDGAAALQHCRAQPGRSHCVKHQNPTNPRSSEYLILLPPLLYMRSTEGRV